MNDSRFNYLLQRFIDKKASPEEEEELKSLVRTGRYQDHFRQDLAHYMNRLYDDPKELPAPPLADELYKRIVSHTYSPVEKPLFSQRKWLRVAAALLLCLGAGWWLVLPKDEKPSVAQKETPPTGNTIIFSEKDYIKLPDGSGVLLNENSELSYQLPFGESAREVTLKGEAFFDIKTDSTKSFIVHTGDISTRVLGTAFNVNARDKNVVVTVERGLVRVSDQTKTLSLVRPDEQLIVNAASHQFEKTGLKAQEEIAWKSNSLIFDNITLRETIGQLQTHFGIQIRIENPAIENCRIDAWFLDNQNLEEVLTMVFGTRQATYTKERNTVTISGGIGCN